MDFVSAFLLLFTVWTFHFYGQNINYLIELVFFTDWATLISEELESDDEDEMIEGLNGVVVEPVVPKYEDKYIVDIRKLNKEWDFTDLEIETERRLFQEFLDGSLENLQSQIEAAQQEIALLEKELAEDIDTIDSTETVNEHGDEVIQDTTLEERNEYRREKIAYLQEECSKLRQELENSATLTKNAEAHAREFIVNQRLDKLKNNFVMEKTPQGNVLMIYDKERGSFKYYADSTIPYRYLEPVGRKYVKLFQCRPLFVDMEEELKLVEEKWTKEYELKKAKEAEEKKRAAENQQQLEQKKKNVFAKFKSYNKDAGGKISMAAPPKNSIPNKIVAETKENEKVLLKERANRYTYEGKLANFSFLQKIERKVFNKKLALSFSEFKKLHKK